MTFRKRLAARGSPFSLRTSAARQPSCYDRENAPFYYADAFTSTLFAGDGRYELSAQTIRNRLRKNNDPIRASRPYKIQIMTTRQVQWARRHFIWPCADWNWVLFIDESRFALSHPDDRTRVYSRTHERYADCCVQDGSF